MKNGELYVVMMAPAMSKLLEATDVTPETKFNIFRHYNAIKQSAEYQAVIQQLEQIAKQRQESVPLNDPEIAEILDIESGLNINSVKISEIPSTISVNDMLQLGSFFVFDLSVEKGE